MENILKPISLQAEEDDVADLQRIFREADGGDPVDIACSRLSVSLSWTKSGTILIIDRLREEKYSVMAEIVVHTTASGRYLRSTPSAINLLSLSNRQSIATHLKTIATAPILTWDKIIEIASRLAIQRARTPFYSGDDSEEEDTPSWCLSPIVPRGMPAIIYGPGGSLKTELSLYLAAIAQAGSSHGPFVGQGVNVLRLDYESTESDFRIRLRRIQRGHSDLERVRIINLRCQMPLAECLDRVEQLTDEIDAKLIILDSLAGAAGGDLEASSTAQRFFEAIRILNRSTLILAHPPRGGQDIFGSIFFRNWARNVWSITKTQKRGESSATLTLEHRKTNVGPELDSIVLRAAFEKDTAGMERVRFSPGEPATASAEDDGSAASLVYQALRSGFETPDAIVDQTHLPGNRVRIELSRGVKKGWAIRLERGQYRHGAQGP